MAFLPRPARLHPVTHELLGVDPRDQMAWKPWMDFVWQKAVYTVPLEVSEERVQSSASKYRNKFGTYLELEGFRVLAMEGPHLDGSVVAAGMTEPDRRRYVIWAKVTRRPITFHLDVLDDDVRLYQQAGFRLT